MNVVAGAAGLWLGLVVLWFILRYAQRLPQPLGNFAAGATKLATPGGV
jgi:hypothetical protein